MILQVHGMNYLTSNRNSNCNGSPLRPVQPDSSFYIRASALAQLLVAAGVLLFMLCGTTHAARLQSTAWTDTTVAAAASSYATLAFPAGSQAEENLHLRVTLSDADISAYTRSPANLEKPEAVPINGSEFSSLGILTSHPSFVLAPQHSGKSANGNQPGVASMPLVVLAWLFGIGVIGIGTVGRRRRKQP